MLVLLPSKGKVRGGAAGTGCGWTPPQLAGTRAFATSTTQKPSSKTHTNSHTHSPGCCSPPPPPQDTYQAVKQASDSECAVPTQCFVAQKAGVGRSSPPAKGRLQCERAVAPSRDARWVLVAVVRC